MKGRFLNYKKEIVMNSIVIGHKSHHKQGRTEYFHFHLLNHKKIAFGHQKLISRRNKCVFSYKFIFLLPLPLVVTLE